MWWITTGRPALSVGNEVDAEGRKRVCLLTGASGTLGSDFCARYADRYSISAVYRHHAPVAASQDATFVDPLDPGAELAVNEHPIFAVQGDISIETDCERIIDVTLARFGRIDLLVHAATFSVWSPMLGTDRLRRSAAGQFITNVVVPLNLSALVAERYWATREVENRMMNRNIVNISSVAGLRLYPRSGQSVYAASKAALNHITGHMAWEFDAIGVRVNATAANSFPSLVPTARATDAIVRLDEGNDTGTIVVVDGDEDRVVKMDPFN
jgi:NAD(P)-dependent dehydrogenase (short-subunit alcohol dehydrogenase family)